MIPLDRLRDLLDQFGTLRIGLVGDLFLDRYLEIDPLRSEISVETGLESHQVTSVRNSPGALGTVMNNLAALGVGRLVPVTVIGDDGHAYDLGKELRRLPADSRFILKHAARLTPTYTKPLVREPNGALRELERLDIRSREPLERSLKERLLRDLKTVFHETDGLIVLDQLVNEAECVVDAEVRGRLRELSRSQRAKLVFIDSRAHITEFDFGVHKTNAAECLRAAGSDVTDDVNAIRRLVQSRSSEKSVTVFCTLGERGMLVAGPDGKSHFVPGFPAAGPVDIVGAGDSATSGIVAALLAGANWEEAATVGNLVASITVQQLGTTGTASPAQVIQRWESVNQL